MTGTIVTLSSVRTEAPRTPHDRPRPGHLDIVAIETSLGGFGDKFRPGADPHPAIADQTIVDD